MILVIYSFSVWILQWKWLCPKSPSQQKCCSRHSKRAKGGSLDWSRYSCCISRLHHIQCKHQPLQYSHIPLWVSCSRRCLSWSSGQYCWIDSLSHSVWFFHPGISAHVHALHFVLYPWGADRVGEPEGSLLWKVMESSGPLGHILISDPPKPQYLLCLYYKQPVEESHSS